VAQYCSCGCLQGTLVFVFAPEPLGVGRESFVEPDVPPPGDGQAVTEPLVGQFVDDVDGGGGGAAEVFPRVDGAGLGFQGRVEAKFGVHDAARGGERVRPEVGGQESEELGLVGEGGLGDRAGVRQVVGGADGPGVLVRGASGGGAGGGPAVPVFVFERCGPVAGGDDLVADEDPHVVDEDAGALYEFVGGVADRDLHLAARVPAEIDRPVFGLSGCAGSVLVPVAAHH